MERCRTAKLAYFLAKPQFSADETLCPLIFVHGFAHTKEIWHDIPQIVAEETGRKAYAIDVRNFGDSEWVDAKDDNRQLAEAMTQDLLHFLNEKKINKAGLIGHSFSGYVCQKLAINHPEKVEFLIVADQFTGKQFDLKSFYNTGMSYYRHWVQAVRSIPPYLNKNDAIRYAVDQLYRQIPEEKQNLLSRKELLCQYDYNLKQNDDNSYDVKDNVETILKIPMELFDNPRLTGTFNGPSYFIIGDCSWYKVYEAKDEIPITFPNSEIIIIEGATHNVHTDTAEEFTNIITKCILKHN